MADQSELITMEEAAARLGVRRATLYYYIKALDLETKKFPLDKRKYLKVADVERIKALREEAAARTKKEDDEAA